ncbi:MAG: hypothetical protein ACRDVD_00510 [Acidimicrobiia bacterium]
MNQIQHQEAAEAMETLDAAGFEYTIVCSGPEALCPGWDRAIAA